MTRFLRRLLVSFALAAAAVASVLSTHA